MKVLYYVICTNMITTSKNNDISYENYMIIQNDLNNKCHEHHETYQILWNMHDIHCLKEYEDKLDK
jgi:hypothetical protein